MVGVRIAPSASTTPLNATAVPSTRPSATPSRSSSSSATPRTMSSNSIPVNTIASRNREILRPLAAPTRESISRSALYTNSVAPEMKTNIDSNQTPPLVRPACSLLLRAGPWTPVGPVNGSVRQCKSSPASPSLGHAAGWRGAPTAPIVRQPSAPSTARREGLVSDADSSSSADRASLSNRASASSHDATAAAASVTPGRVEVVARADRGEPLLVAGKVDVGLLELGVRRPAAAALVLELLVELPRALDQLAVLIGPLALHRVDDRGLLPCVCQLDAKHLAAAALRAQARHEPRRGPRGLRRRREHAHRLLQVVGAEAAQVAPGVDAERRRAAARSGDRDQQPVTCHVGP